MHPSVATELGVMAALRTGDPVRDLALCAAVPLAVERLRESPHTVTSLVEAAKQRVGDLLAGGRSYTTHRVELLEFGHRSATDIKAIDENDHRELLFNAVRLYVADQVSLAAQSGRYALFCSAAQTDALADALLTKAETPGIVERQRSQIQHALQSNRELAQLDVQSLPPIGHWVPLHDGDLEMQYLEVESTTQPGKKARVRAVRKSFTFRSRAIDAPQKIHAFVDRAFAHYTAVEKRKVEGNATRYLYVREMTSAVDEEEPEGDDDDDSRARKSAPRFKRYALGEEKTFDTVFFDEKPMVLKLLDDFAHKTGKFAIEGFPNKLGLLLHGPPGTGKTSLIKAIAQHTKRHIVSISLAKIQTNQELLDAMTDLRFAVRGVSVPIKFGFEDVVFVMEDVDCATSVVKNRSEERDQSVSSDTGGDAAGENPFAMLAALLGQDELLQQHGLTASANRTDKLNLSGLLNVLDGAIDCPGRIVIMTTNHPEKLDPALIRPGRVNKKIHLAWMPPAQIQKMLEYYFDTQLTDELETRVLALSETITPAEVEEICAEQDELADAVAALEEQVQIKLL